MGTVRLAWDQAPGETALEYHKFRSWLGFSPGQRELPVRHLDTASKWKWTERAEQFDRSQEIDKLTSEEQLALLGRSMPGTLLAAQRKYADQLSDPNFKVSARDLKDLSEVQALSKDWEPKAEVDISQLTDEQRETYRKFRAMERKLLKEGKQ